MEPYAEYCERCHGLFGETKDATLDLADPTRQSGSTTRPSAR
jgi:hypothetical protein